MDYMPNGTLNGVNRQFYAGRAPPAWNPTARSQGAIGIVAGMCFIHSLGLLHRSLCPANILLDENWEVRISGSFRMPPVERYPQPARMFRFEWHVPPECGNDDDPWTTKCYLYAFAFCLYARFLEPKTLDDGCPPSSGITRFYAVQKGARVTWRKRTDF
jgi:serine/threonine protein kinase